MPQSLSAVYVHLVFSTKDRRAYLQDRQLREEMHCFLGGVSKRLECAPVITGGIEDHIHMLSRLHRTISQADWVKEIKRASSVWIKEKDPSQHDFSTCINPSAPLKRHPQ